MIGDWLYGRSVTAAGCDENRGNPLRDFFAYASRCGTCGHPWFFDSYRIGNCSSLVSRVFEIWQFAFPTFVASNNCAGNHFKRAGT